MTTGVSGRIVATYKGQYAEAVQRSLMTLKAMTYRPTGGIVAAVTTGLPERDWRGAELGLSLLLAAGYGVHAAGADARGIHGGGGGVEAVAAARDCGIAGAGAEFVWDQRREALAGVGGGLAAGL